MIETIASSVSAIAAAIGLFFAGYELRKSNQNQELELIENTFNKIILLECQLYEKYLHKKESIKQWSSLFLIN